MIVQILFYLQSMIIYYISIAASNKSLSFVKTRNNRTISCWLFVHIQPVISQVQVYVGVGYFIWFQALQIKDGSGCICYQSENVSGSLLKKRKDSKRDRYWLDVMKRKLRGVVLKFMPKEICLLLKNYN